VILADSIVGTFDSVSVENNTLGFKVAITYASTSVNVVVAKIPPSFTKGAAQSVKEDAGAVTVKNWATGVSTGTGPSSQTAGFRATARRTALFSTQPAIASDGTLSFQSAPDSNGTTWVLLRLGASETTDSSALDSFQITVRPVNDAPTFVPGQDRRVLWNSGADSVVGWATSISAGPPDEAGQKTGFAISNDNASLFAVQPTLSATGTLRYTPAAGVLGTAHVRVRLGDDGGTTDGGVDSSAIDTFRIDVQPSLTFHLVPDTLRLRDGDTARFRAWSKASGGTDSAQLGSDQFSWSWSPTLGSISAQGLISASKKGTSKVVAAGFGSSDTAVLVVVPFDTTFGGSTDTVKVSVGHRIRIAIPPHFDTVPIEVHVADSSLRARGIAGSDTALVVTTGIGIRISAPWSLVPTAARTGRGTPSVFTLDSAGRVHLVASTALSDSSSSFVASRSGTWWLGYDTVPPRVAGSPSSDSISTSPVKIDWSLADNVAETGLWLCLRPAGSTASRCSLLVSSDTATGTASIARSLLPLGGRVWLEGRDSRTTVATTGHDVVVQLDTLRAGWTRTEDRYEFLSLPYVAGAGSAEGAFTQQWGENDVHRWRAWGADSGRFQEILPGTPLDAAGRGFWVRTRKLPLVPWSSGRWTYPVSTPVSVALQPGWNAVGNPLGFDVSWRQIRNLSGLDSLSVTGPYVFDGPSQSWNLPDTTSSWPSWKGVAILNSTGRTVVLRVSSLPDATATAAARQATATSSGTRVSFTLAQTSSVSSSLWIGRAATARTLPLPPTPSAGVQAWLVAADGSTADLLDLRASTDTTSWLVRATGLVPRTPATLTFGSATGDSTEAPWVHDDKSGRWIAAGRSLEFAVGDEQDRTFRIRFGQPAAVAGKRVFGFDTRGRTLLWDLPDQMGRVRVRVDAFDPLGRRLAVLVDEDMDPGSYSRSLDVRSPTGQMLLVLSAGGQRRTLQRFFLR